SVAHKTGRMNFDDIDCERSYSPRNSYAQAKLANLLFALELHHRCRAANAAVSSIAVHPGISATNLMSTGAHTGGKPTFDMWVLEKLSPLIFQSGARGAIPSLYAATAADAEAGAYYGPCGLLEVAGRHPKAAAIARQGRDPEAAQRLWQLSEQR